MTDGAFFKPGLLTSNFYSSALSVTHDRQAFMISKTKKNGPGDHPRDAENMKPRYPD